IPLHLW
ncbi:hypothetical protein CP8484711_1741, partial [Chlamydia psittaci 84-8471/1]